MNDFFLGRLRPIPVMAILRGLSPQDAVARVEACWTADIRLVEVSLSHMDAIRALEAISARPRPEGAVVGAGTIIDLERGDRAIDAGARFFVSPGINEKIATFARDKDIPLLPGVATATEIQSALDLGYEVVKMFPATILGIPWLEAMKGPFPQVSFVATGGVTLNNAHDFLSHGASGVAMGSSLDPARVGQLQTHPEEIDGKTGHDPS